MIKIDTVETLITTVDNMLNTKRKRHLTGGILFSCSALFGCLAITVITLSKEKFEDE